jgi:hypothetical protein
MFALGRIRLHRIADDFFCGRSDAHFVEGMFAILDLEDTNSRLSAGQIHQLLRRSSQVLQRRARTTGLDEKARFRRSPESVIQATIQGPVADEDFV